MLLALADPNHVHHERAHGWFSRGAHQARATCPITENGFVRIASHPSYPNRPGEAPAVLELLRVMCQSPGHRFCPDTLSLRTSLCGQGAFTHQAVTDLYLLALAMEHGAKLATLDGKIPASTLVGGAQVIELLP